MTTTRKFANCVLAAALALSAFACSRDDENEAAAPVSDEPAVGEVDPIAPGDDVQPFEALTGPAYEGVWALSEDICDVTPGSADPAPIAITEREFIGYENRCLIASAEEGTEGGWTLELVCEGEGVEYRETVDVDVDGETISLKSRDDDVPDTRLVRCEGA